MSIRVIFQKRSGCLRVPPIGEFPSGKFGQRGKTAPRLEISAGTARPTPKQMDNTPGRTTLPVSHRGGLHRDSPVGRNLGMGATAMAYQGDIQATTTVGSWPGKPRGHKARHPGCAAIAAAPPKEPGPPSQPLPRKYCTAIGMISHRFGKRRRTIWRRPHAGAQADSRLYWFRQT